MKLTGETVRKEDTMVVKDTLLSLRKDRGLTQDEMAQRLSMTRQAISRWETGETAPSIDTLRLIATTFDVPVSQILELPEHNACQSCGMPLADVDLLGTDENGSPSPHFCKWCYVGGEYVNDDLTMDEMLDICVEHMATPESGFTEEQAREYMGKILPTLDRWK